MKTKLKRLWHDFFVFPKYMVFHPFDGFEEFKRYKQGRLSVALIFIALFAFYRIMAYQYESVLINPHDPYMLNSIQMIVAVFLLIGLFTVGNWSVTTLMSGKGTYKEILMTTGYALFPLLVIGFPGLLVSNVLTLEEMGFYRLMLYIAYAGTGWFLFMGILNIHEYGLFKTLIAFGLTAVAMSVMMFLGLLFFDLIQQIISFVSAIYEELSLR